MKYPRYPKYKDSGVEWLGDVPEGWKLFKVSWHIPMTIGWTPPSGKDVYYGGKYNWVTISDLSSGCVEDTQNKITDEAIEDKKATPAPANSLLFAYKLSIGAVAILNKPAYTNEAIAAFRPNEHVSMLFWYYAAPVILPTAGRLNIYGAMLLNQELMNSCRFYAPPREAQERIAAFLAHETAKIDALIAEQEKLITLLREKRQAVISQAVTKGLNPDAPMKDSGVEWLGKVPKGWTVNKLSAISLLIQTGPFGSQLHADEYVLDGVPIINPQNITENGVIKIETNTVDSDTAEKLTRHKLEPGDLVFGRRGEMGRCAIITGYEHGWICGTGCLKVTINQNIMSPIFAVRYFGINLVKQFLALYSVGATMDNLNTQILSTIPFPTPPISEQQAIVEYLDSETAKIADLIAEAQKAVELLKERRSAIISAAVTGKIDVRDIPLQEAV